MTSRAYNVPHGLLLRRAQQPGAGGGFYNGLTYYAGDINRLISVTKARDETTSHGYLQRVAGERGPEQRLRDLLQL